MGHLSSLEHGLWLLEPESGLRSGCCGSPVEGQVGGGGGGKGIILIISVTYKT